MRRLEYTIRRLALSIGVLIGLSIITFTLTRIVPSNPAALYLGPKAPPEALAQITEELGLNDPIPAQYIRYVDALLHGDLGISIATKQPVLKEIQDRLPATIELLVTAMILAVIIGIPLGVMSAQLKGKSADFIVRIVSIVGVSVPQFWLGLLLQMVFGLGLGWVMAGRIDSTLRFTDPIVERTGFYIFDAFISGNWTALGDVLAHLILPALTLAAYPIGLIARMTRANMIEVLEQNYIRTANAYGVPQYKIVYVYALKNALIPVMTVLGLTLAYALTGAFYIEIIFNWPGLGQFTAKSFLSLDYPSIMGVTLYGAMSYILINLIIDVLQSAIDPRVTLE